MKKIIALFSLFFGCDTGNLPVIADIPISLREVSGIETSSGPEDLWMINDGGNKAELFLVNTKGEIQKIVKIDAKNRDWEDITSDPDGNIYIGDFGNNKNKRKNLAVLKVSKDSLSNDTTKVDRISFSYEDQHKFPPKKKQMRFDSEAFFYYNDSLYLFTKSRVKNDFGHTNLYKIPAAKGNHKAQLIGSFKTCDELPCWITAADISDDKKTVALLTLNSVWTFTDFKGDAFFSGEVKKHDLGFKSQKESLCFKGNNTLFIADESTAGIGGNLYQFNLNEQD